MLTDREFKELLEEVYKQKFNNKDYIKELINQTKVIPLFSFNKLKNIIQIYFKNEDVENNNSDLNKFYDDIQNIKVHKTKEIEIQIDCDNNIYDKVLKKYSDIIYFENEPNTKFYTRKYFKEKILVELKALEDILEYSIENKLVIKINSKEVVPLLGSNFKFEFNLEEKNNNYYLVLNQNIKKMYYIIHTNKYMYTYYDNKLYIYNKKEIKDIYPILKIFFKNSINRIFISKKNLTNFFSLIYPNLLNNIYIQEDVFNNIKKYIPQKLTTKLYLDFDNRNFLVADLKFCYLDIEFNPIEQNQININRNILEETNFLNKLIKTGFLLDKGNKRFILDKDDNIYNFIQKELEEYNEISQIYSTESFNKKGIKITSPNVISVKVDNGLLELDIKNVLIEKEEIKDILQKYKLKKKYYRLKDGKFITLEDNKDIKFLSNLLDGLDISYKDIKETIQLPINRTLYLEKLLKQNKQIQVNSNDKYKKVIEDINNKDEFTYIPKILEEILRDYQKTGSNWLTTIDRYGFGGILADDMGLGKTIQLLSVLLINKEKSNNKQTSLVVAPSSLTLNWKSEAQKFAKDLEVLVITGTAEERKEKIQSLKKYDLAITSYDLLKRDIEEYEKVDYTFRYIIADEAQYIKNNNTQNSKTIKRIKANTKFALTGTPIENSLSELWSIFDFIMPGYLFTYKKFKKNYEVPIVKDKDEEALKKLKMIIEPFILRRTKKEVLKELPDKTTIILNNEMIKEQEKIYLSYLAQARDELNDEIEDKGFEKSRIKILALLTRLRQICCHPSLFISNYKEESGKLNQCIELVKDGIQSKHKILLFSGYTSMFEIIEKELIKENITYLKFTGKTNVKDRFELIKKFNQQDDIKVFLISLKAGGTGINLTSADMVIHYDPWWNLSVENQATDRTHRIGQTKKVQVYKLITKNSIEEKIYELQQRKKELIDNMLSTDTKFINKLSKEDILKLFE